MSFEEIASKRSSEVVFRRIRGRIVPIRVKRKDGGTARGITKLVAAAAITGLSVIASARVLGRARKFFKISAQIRGRGFRDPKTKRLLASDSPRLSRTRKLAAKAKVLGMKKAGRAKFILGIGTLGATFLSTTAVNDLAKGKLPNEAIEALETTTGLLVPLLGVAAFGKLAKIKGIRKTLKGAIRGGSPSFEVSEAFGEFARTGRKQTQRVLRKFRKGAQQKQLELFKGSENKRLEFLNKFLKGTVL